MADTPKIVVISSMLTDDDALIDKFCSVLESHFQAHPPMVVTVEKLFDAGISFERDVPCGKG